MDTQTFELQELRLLDSADPAEAAAIVAARASASGRHVPLLVSVTDRRDVAVVRTVRSGDPRESEATERRPLDGLVAVWHPSLRYVAKIQEETALAPSHYRLAVTESGVNNAPDAAAAVGGDDQDSVPTPVERVWVGVPVGSYAGLFVLVGDHGAFDASLDATAWPVSLGQQLGVRIYDNQA